MIKRAGPFLLSLLAALPAYVAAAEKAAPKPVVMVDPGHGGTERGVRFASTDEANYVLALAKSLAEILKKQGVDARLTRDTDRFLPPLSRTAMAAENNAAALISLHVNHSYNESARGLRAFVPATGLVDEPAAPLWEQASRTQAAASRSLGLLLAQSLGESSPRAVQSLKLALFRGLVLPAVEVELDYVSNGEAAAALSASGEKERIAAKLAQGVLAFLRQNHSNGGGGASSKP